MVDKETGVYFWEAVLTCIEIISFEASLPLVTE